MPVVDASHATWGKTSNKHVGGDEADSYGSQPMHTHTTRAHTHILCTHLTPHTSHLTPHTTHNTTHNT